MRRAPVERRRVLLLMAGLLAVGGPARHADTRAGPVGHRDFDDSTGRDLSGLDHPAHLGGTRIHSLGAGHACLEVGPDVEPLRIAVTPDPPLALARGTVCLGLNVAWADDPTILEYDNGAVELRIYRRHFQPRFRGKDDFRYGSRVLDANWPRYDLREWASYPHVRAAVGDSQWRTTTGPARSSAGGTGSGLPSSI
ncbi:MAG: hypothetical protein MUC88_15135 [Planctomycetes bacterium]|nr:hypothetical protein [Planctomycetota bacterium]